MKVLLLLLAIAVILTALLVDPSTSVQSEVAPSRAWTASYDGPANTVDLAHDLAVDSDGNVYVTGSSTL